MDDSLNTDARPARDRADELRRILNTMASDSTGIVIVFRDDRGKATCLRGNMGRLDACELLVQAGKRLIRNFMRKGD